MPVFGPGAIGVSVQHVYKAPGDYPVTLILDGGSAGQVANVTTVIVR